MNHNNFNYRNFCAIRNQQRANDIAESKNILLELGCYEPTMQQCLKIIQANCLGQGIACRIDNSECSKSFQTHLELHYIPFLKESLRSMLVFGFVPYRLRRIRSGDMIPEVLPPGTFHWETALIEEHGSRKRPLQNRDDETKLLTYRITPEVPGFKEEDVCVYNYINPTYNIQQNSNLFATVISPLSHVLNDYRNLKNAQARRQYADSWNCTSQLITTFKPTIKVQDDPSSALLDFQDAQESNPYFNAYKTYFPQMKGQSWFERSHMIQKQLEASATNHMPNVWCLPREHDIVPQSNLTPVEDVAWLYEKFQRNLAAIIGIPYEMLAGKSSNENTRKTMTSGRIFTSNMSEFCSHCQYLLRQIYCQIYKTQPERVQFLLSPMPRLEIESIEDFKVLYEIGALSPDSSVQLSKILLGNGPKMRPRPNNGNAIGTGDDSRKDLQNDKKQNQDMRAI